VLDDAYFGHLARIMAMSRESDYADRIPSYLRQNRLDEEQVMLAMAKLNANLQDRLNPDSGVMEATFPGCADKVAFSEEERALLEGHLQELLGALEDGEAGSGPR
ncbi:MAG: hypothetical protein LBF40_09855, partial [Deltaproteobacteria bacterium]|nr:hypothetical protein [Deltaproteobacteria bacterium]